MMVVHLEQASPSSMQPNDLPVFIDACRDEELAARFVKLGAIPISTKIHTIAVKFSRPTQLLLNLSPESFFGFIRAPQTNDFD